MGKNGVEGLRACGGRAVSKATTLHAQRITTDAWHDGKPFHFSPEPEIFSTDFLFFLPLIILGSMFLPTLAGALALYGSMPALHSNIRRPLVAMRLVDHTPPPTANVDHAAASVSRLLSAPRSQNLPKLDEADHEVLESGSMLMRTYQTEGRASEGFAVQVVQAPTEHIWQSILDWTSGLAWWMAAARRRSMKLTGITSRSR